MFSKNKTIDEIQEYIESIAKCNDIEIPTIEFKEMARNGSQSVVRLSYYCEQYSYRNDDYTRTKMVYWLIFGNDICINRVNQYSRAKAIIGIKAKPRKERIIRDHSAIEFDNMLCKEAKEAKDKGYCGIRAYGNITKTPYAESKALCAQYGWDHKGMRTHELLKLFKDQGYFVEEATEHIRKRAKTIKTFEELGFSKNYLILVSNHFVSSVNGVITDWTAGKKKIIKKVWQISK